MATFERSSKWLKLSFLEVHLALFLLLFPLAAATGLTSGPVSVLTVTSFFLLCACVLTYTWVYIREIYNNRIIHLSVMISDFLVALFSIISIIVLYNWNNNDRLDNLIEAAVGVSILSFLAGLFAICEMKDFKFKLGPIFRKKKNKINVEQAKQGEAVDTVATINHKDSNPVANNSETTVSDNKVSQGVFYKTSMWLKYALYLFGMALMLSFLPTEPVMSGGTREVTSLVYLCGIVGLTLLFCWVYVGSMYKKKFVHIVTAILVFLTGFLCVLAMILWLVSWSMLHPFTPVIVLAAGILAAGAGAAVVLEIRQIRLSSQGRYFDREWAASCFTGVLRTCRIQGVNVTVEHDESSINGDLAEKYHHHHVEEGVSSSHQNLQQPPPPPPAGQPEAAFHTSAKSPPPPPPSGKPEVGGKKLVEADTSEGFPPNYQDVHQGEGKKGVEGGKKKVAASMPPVSGMGDEYPRKGFNPFDEGD